MIEADEEATRKAHEAAYRQVAGRVNVPGFRRGKAPRQMVERLVGRDTILREAAQIALPNLYRQALEETGIDPLYDPNVDIISLEPLSFKVTVPVRPTVQLPEYQNIRLPKTEASVTDELVEQTLSNIREQHAEWTPVERAAQEGDTAVISAHASQGEERILDEHDIEYLVDPARNIPVPGFAEHVVGLSAGEDKTFSITFPADYRVSTLAGKEAQFEVSVQSVKEKRLPEMDDDLAKTAGDFETLDQLRENVRTRLLENAQASADEEYQGTVVNTVVEQSQIEMPAEMIEEQAESSLHDLEDRLQAQNLSMPVYLNLVKQTRIQLLESMREEARMALRRQLVLNEVAQKEGIEISDADIDAEIEAATQMLGNRAEAVRKALNTDEGRRNAAFRLRQRKARERLAEIASQPAEGAAAAQPEAE
jgi:trigger factor